MSFDNNVRNHVISSLSHWFYRVTVPDSSSSSSRCVWWESRGTMSSPMRRRQSNGELVTSSTVRPPLWPRFKGRARQMMATVTMGPRTDSAPGRTWGAGFQPRERVETSRNCASLPRDFVDKVVLQVANALLGLTDGPGSCSDWNQGGKLQHSNGHETTKIKRTKSLWMRRFGSNIKSNASAVKHVDKDLLFSTFLNSKLHCHLE